MKALSDTAASEGRDLAAEEYETYNRLEADLRAKGAEVERLEREAGIESSLTRDVALAPQVPTEGGEGRARIVETDEYRDAFVSLIRARGNMAALGGDEQRVLSKGTLTAGGYTVPDAFIRDLYAAARVFGNISGRAFHIETADAGQIKWPRVTGHVTMTWTGENVAYTESDVAVDQFNLDAHKGGILSRVSDELIQDSAFDILGFLAQDMGEAFGLGTNAAYTAAAAGAADRPEGLFPQADVGVTLPAGNTTSITADGLIDLVYSVISPYRANGVWQMSDATIQAARKLKTTDGQYLWQPGLQAGQPDTLLGYPIDVNPDVPAMAASARSVGFGDIRRAYVIRDVLGVQVKILNERYADLGQVGVRAELRTDGDVRDTSAFKVLVNSAT